jgi:hypothetical protein
MPLPVAVSKSRRTPCRLGSTIRRLDEMKKNGIFNLTMPLQLIMTDWILGHALEYVLEELRIRQNL